MALAQFYHDALLKQGQEISLDEDTARHVVQVLRMVAGEQLQLTDGKGHVAITSIIQTEKKKCRLRVDAVTFHEAPAAGLHLCLGFTKNASRNEWLLEKATELGIKSITPLITTRTEREKLRYDRLKNILISALLQSQQYHLPMLHEAMSLKAALEYHKEAGQKLVGHCIDTLERKPLAGLLKPGKETVILIGPEGDFTEEEVNLCIEAQYAGVTMGTQRLRTETAAMAACAYFNLINHA